MTPIRNIAFGWAWLWRLIPLFIVFLGASFSDVWEPGSRAAVLPADPLATWHPRTNFQRFMRGFATGDGILVAGDTSGFMHTSRDGANWTFRETGTNEPVYALAYGNGRFVGMRGFGGFATSLDGGATWSNVARAPFSQLFGIVYAQGVFTAAGYILDNLSSPVLFRSTDGMHWTSRAVGSNAVLRGIAYGNGLYVAAGHQSVLNGGLVLTSPDGEAWTRQPTSLTPMSGIAFGNGMFVAISGSQVARSTNGVDWTAQAVLAVQEELFSISFVEGTFVGCGSPRVLVTSSNGIDWVYRDSKLTSSGTLAGAGAVGGRIVIGGDGPLLQSDPFESALPLLSRQPTARSQRVGSTYTNSVSVDSPSAVLYRWERDGVAIPDGTNAILVVSNAQAELSGGHSVVVTSSGGSIRSDVVPVLLGEPAVITVQPVGQQVVQGGTATFSVVAGGSPPFSFRWRRNGRTTNYIVLNENTSFLVVTNVQSGADYTVAVSNLVSQPGELSAPATLVVLADSDGDGLPDGFEDEHGLNRDDPSDGALDSDGDGASNLAEYVAGTDPRDAQSSLKVAPLSLAIGAGIEFAVVAGQTYTVQFRDALNAGVWNRLADVPAQATSGIRRVTDPAPALSRFYRLVTPRQP